ncbi:MULTISPECIES: 3-methyl-2-oxobutanoate hydroxymethyltransferase [unclassified Fusibacter]|uniref:3-methyl-2-oxobutanoate hydroxymethyltransferase n=1 Tax=unclassified Fusibacter TaxID=2624464 RepID=UPI001011A112|nr:MULTISPECIES: 3-methyl-2-oxobutanoate hydroxymethyltransferase [unclassified Fusibacter]MCK8061031.1 3-methyl-2-oxobutanoate hydroxymethyltransferase [Fusibacter sp. A2]NPE20515.1 3-methyl-2-oxobutanoate hydroxymethyltransferase [Fusibacter sp. A1]RXV63785.1 3-methyl-2-oxobutanoate hydroxymethyltransferase [Fusibacter sp. A1]
MKKRFSNQSFSLMKTNGEKISMMTAYDYSSAKLSDQAGMDTLLVGDSLGMVMLGYDDTLKVTMQDMIHHAKAVRRGAPEGFMIVDMPYLSYHISVEESVRNAGRLVTEAGANAIKLEGGKQFLPAIKAILHAQIPVIGHLGLTPQSVNAFGGYKVQAKEKEAAKLLLEDALALQEAGVSAIVLECIPPDIAKWVSQSLVIPTIGIGAGSDVDGQVLVFHDVLGIYDKISPKFVKQYAQLGNLMKEALTNYHNEVKTGEFPKEEHSFKPSDVELETLY